MGDDIVRVDIVRFDADPGILALTRVVSERFRSAPHPTKPSAMVFLRDFAGRHDERRRTPVNMSASSLLHCEIRGAVAIVHL